MRFSNLATVRYISLVVSIKSVNLLDLSKMLEFMIDLKILQFDVSFEIVLTFIGFLF